MTKDYPVFLPKTDFPMRGDLPKREPDIAKNWQSLSQKDLENQKDQECFILHDGPPYANGAIHIGHALNKILKDVINRTQRMLGKKVVFIPGWDCHGLPIEWKIEEDYRKAKKAKTDNVLAFREECRRYAAEWIEKQKEDFKRLGIDALWDKPYVTMDKHIEAQIAGEILTVYEKGLLYPGFRPILWSVIEQTALAEAEVEYHPHTSTAVYVAFPVIHSPLAALANAEVVIWTTTPWTLPANAALAANPALDYVLVEAEGRRLILAEALAEKTLAVLGLQGTLKERFPGTALAGLVAAHPLAAQGYTGQRPLILADFVTADTGTGFVHIAPAHGEDDFACFPKGQDFPQVVRGDGTYTATTPLFAGQHIFKVKTAILEALGAAGALLHAADFEHSYPHSWRSKAPLIYLATPQWFINLNTGVRQEALDACEQVKFFPEEGKKRLTSTIAARPDWCVSRQRTWGVPIPLFVHRDTGEPLLPITESLRKKLREQILDSFHNEGADAWWTKDVHFYLNEIVNNPADYQKVTDILDVWFDSGASHSYVFPDKKDSDYPVADLYLEGSDQHRGWFQASLLESVATREKAPFRQVLTHGFVLDEAGRKMSKSLGNVISPQEVVDKYGADVLRLWVITQDYENDLRIGKGILEQTAEKYRQFRNTLRYLLGATAGYDAEKEAIKDGEQIPDLEQYVDLQLDTLKQSAQRLGITYDFRRFYNDLHAFCVDDLSAFYLDIRKDALYCDAPDSLRRRACRGLLVELLHCLNTLLAPILPFTAEEAWVARGKDGSIHQQFFQDPSHRSYSKGFFGADIKDLSKDSFYAFRRGGTLRTIRRVVLGALEKARAAKEIGSSLQAAITLYMPQNPAPTANWAEICIVSKAEVTTDIPPADAFRLADVPDVAVVVTRAEGEKCPRCWQVGAAGMGSDANHPELCGRCAEAVKEYA
ncbi:MAG: isoleucine--tRNA ligase [Holosporales bacterium]|jgi:isoleucyl-tRNA synthetase